MPGDIHVLCVDDDPEFASLTADFLEQQDSALDVTAETSALDALDRLDDARYDCVVSDYDMPEMNGLEFLEAVREVHDDVPFILFTGKGSEEIASDAVTAGVTDYLQKNPGSEQYELLANRVTNAVDAHRAEARADKHARVNSIVNDVNQALVRAKTRADVHERVCEIIAASDPYAFAWVGEVDDAGEIAPRASAGDSDGYLDAITVTAGDEPTGRGPAGTAVRTGEIQVVQTVADADEFEPWRDTALDRGFHACAAVPLVHDDASFGVLVVYADREYTFDDTEVALLEELAGDVAHALDALDVREELERYRTIVEASGDPVFTVNRDGEFTYVNAAFEDLTGYSSDDLDGAPVSVLLDDDQLRAVNEPYEALLADDDHEQKRFEVDIETADGDRVPCEVHAATLSAAEGFQGVTGIARDVTDRKAREAELAAQNEKIERLHEVATTLDEYDDPDAIYERIVAAAEDILEFDRCIVDAVDGDELVTRAVSSSVPREGYYERTPVDADDNLAAHAYRSGESSAVDDLFEEGADPATDEYRSVLTAPIGDYGVFQAVTTDAAAFDETDLELAELLAAHATQDLRQIAREETLEGVHTAARALMDAETPEAVCERAVDTLDGVFGESLSGIWLYDESTGVLEPAAWSTEAESEFDEIPTYTLSDSVSGRAFQAGEMRVVDSMQDEPDTYDPETDVESELVLPLGDHGVMNIGKLEDSGFSEWEESLAQTFAANVQTALRRATYTRELEARQQELERQNERLQQFANLVSHDLRNPLTTASGRVELAADATDDDAIEEHLAKARTAHDRMDALIEDVLRLARDGQTIQDLEAVSLADVVRESWQTTRTASAELTVVDDLPFVSGDRERLKAVFENLFRNAVEHGGDGVTIEVGLLEDASANGAGVAPEAERGESTGGFYVEDDGDGLPDDDHPDLFSLGYSTVEDGTGFGLAIVHEIVEAHGWDVAVTTGSDGGARFEFTGVTFASPPAADE